MNVETVENLKEVLPFLLSGFVLGAVLMFFKKGKV